MRCTRSSVFSRVRRPAACLGSVCALLLCLRLAVGDGLAAETSFATLPCDMGAVRAVAFSPDGRLLAVGADGSRDVQVWDAADRRRLHLLKQLNWDAIVRPGAAPVADTASHFAALTFLPDGRLATCTDKPLEVPPRPAQQSTGDYSEVRIWDARRGTLLQTVTYAAEALNSLAAPGGQTLMAAPDTGMTLVRWDVRTKATTPAPISDDDWRRWVPGVTPAEVESGGLHSLRCTRDGRALACELEIRYRESDAAPQMGSAYPPLMDVTKLLLWDATGRVTHGLAAGDPLAFSPDGATLAALPAPSDGAAKDRVDMWDVATGRLVHSLTGLTDPASAVFTPDGRTLAVGGRDGSVTLCPLKEGGSRRTLRAALPPLPAVTTATNAVRSLAVSPDGHFLAAGCGDGAVRVWRLTAPGT